MRKLLISTFCTLLLAAVATAQEAKKPLSPKQQVEYRTNNKTITVDYSAPSVRGRRIFGELVPYGQLWRTGANQATTLTTTADLMIGSLHVPAGTYTLFTIPTEKEWTLVVSKQTGLWGTNKYDQAQDLGRVKMSVVPLNTPVEQFTIAVGDTLALSWENTRAWVPVIVH